MDRYAQGGLQFIVFFSRLDLQFSGRLIAMRVHAWRSTVVDACTCMRQEQNSGPNSAVRSDH